MIIVIIAAGQGKRIRPLTETRLKGSLPILDKSILVKLAEMLEQTGLMDKLLLVVSPGQQEEILALFAKQSFFNKVEVTVQDPPKGTADAIAQAKPFIKKGEAFIALNGDIVAPLDKLIPKMLQDAHRLQAMGMMAVIEGKNERYGAIRLSPEGKILEIREKEQVDKLSGKSYINAGVYFFDYQIFDAIKATKLSTRNEFEITDSFKILGAKGIIGATIIQSWMSIENPLDLFFAQTFLPISERLQCMQFHSGNELGFKVAENLYFDKDTSVTISGVVFHGPVFLGRGTFIEQESQIGPYTFLGENCAIGARNQLKHTLFLENCKTSSDCTISYAVFGEDCTLGSNVKVIAISHTKEKEYLKNKDKLTLEDMVLVGGKSLITNKVIITHGVKIAAHSVIKSEDKL